MLKDKPQLLKRGNYFNLKLKIMVRAYVGKERGKLWRNSLFIQYSYSNHVPHPQRCKNVYSWKVVCRLKKHILNLNEAFGIWVSIKHYQSRTLENRSLASQKLAHYGPLQAILFRLSDFEKTQIQRPIRGVKVIIHFPRYVSREFYVQLSELILEG